MLLGGTVQFHHFSFYQWSKPRIIFCPVLSTPIPAKESVGSRLHTIGAPIQIRTFTAITVLAIVRCKGPWNFVYDSIWVVAFLSVVVQLTVGSAHECEWMGEWVKENVRDRVCERKREWERKWVSGRVCEWEWVSGMQLWLPVATLRMLWNDYLQMLCE